MAKTKTKATEKKDPTKIRKEILDEIKKYQYDNEGSDGSVKRFVKKDPVMMAENFSDKKNDSGLEANADVPDSQVVAATPQVKQIIHDSKSAGALPSRPFFKRPIVWIVGLIAVVLVVFIYSFYHFRLDRRFPALAQNFSWPVAYVNGNFLYIKDLQSDVEVLRFFYTTLNLVPADDPSLTLSQLEATALDRMVRDSIIKQFASENNITVSQDRLLQEYNSVAEGFGGEDKMLEYLSTSYKWDAQAFKDKILMPYLLRDLVQDWFLNNQSVQISALDKVNQLQDDIVGGKISFEDAALQYSEDPGSGPQKGALGDFTPGTMYPEFEYAVKALAIGQISEPVKTPAGWHIIRRDQISAGASADTLSASHILITIFDLDSWLNKEVAKAKVFTFLKI